MSPPATDDAPHVRDDGVDGHRLKFETRAGTTRRAYPVPASPVRQVRHKTATRRRGRRPSRASFPACALAAAARAAATAAAPPRRPAAAPARDGRLGGAAKRARSAGRPRRSAAPRRRRGAATGRPGTRGELREGALRRREVPRHGVREGHGRGAAPAPPRPRLKFFGYFRLDGLEVALLMDIGAARTGAFSARRFSTL